MEHETRNDERRARGFAILQKLFRGKTSGVPIAMTLDRAEARS